MDTRQHMESLHGIRENALLLSLGHEYLCHETLIKKFGLDIGSNLERLRDDIDTLKKRFPGKFVFQQKVDPDGLIEELHRIAERLKNPDEEISKKCSTGELGKKLEAGVEVLARVIEEITDQVEGRGVTYTAKEALAKQLGRFAKVLKAIGRTTKLVIKIVLILAFIALLPIIFLYVTMEKEGKLHEDIARMKQLIPEQRKIIAQCDDEIAQLSQEIDALREATENPSRQQILEIMELNVKIHQLGEVRQKAEITINTHENDIAEKTASLESLKKKTFIEKLLRR